MFVKKLILLCLAVALLPPFADAKTPQPAKPSRHHRVRSHKAKIKNPKAKWGSYKVKTKTAN
jgi:hypothetical protein